MSVQFIPTLPRGHSATGENKPVEPNSRTGEPRDSFQSVVDQFLAHAPRDTRNATEKSAPRERGDETAKKRDAHDKSTETNTTLSPESAAATGISQSPQIVSDAVKQSAAGEQTSAGDLNGNCAAQPPVNGKTAASETASDGKSSGTGSDATGTSLAKELSGEKSLAPQPAAAGIVPAGEASEDSSKSGQKIPAARTQVVTAPDKVSATQLDSAVSSTGKMPAARLDATAPFSAASVNENGSGDKISAARSSATDTPSLNGISGAQQDTAMKRPSKTTDITGQAEQKLPVEPALNARNPFPSAERVGGNDSASAASNLSQTSAITEHAATGAAHQTAMPRALERASDLIQLHAVRFSDSSANSLRVVIKPGGGIQLSLDLRQDGDGVQVQALLDRGNYDLLNRHWTELQQQLEARGVRLAPLMNPGQSAAGNDHSRGHQQTDEEPQDAIGDFDFRGTRPVPAAAHYRKSGSSWESWA